MMGLTASNLEKQIPAKRRDFKVPNWKFDQVAEQKFDLVAEHSLFPSYFFKSFIAPIISLAR